MSATNERPILFSTPMVQAILRGEKSVTRRVVKPEIYRDSLVVEATEGRWMEWKTGRYVKCPYPVGTIMWVRETWLDTSNSMGHHVVAYKSDGKVYDKNTGRWYLLDDLEDANWSAKGHWKAPMFMPRWATRLFLRVTNVRAERLQEIDVDDVLREGIGPNRGCFRHLWDTLHKGHPERVWGANPWVWRIEFDRVENPTKGATP